MYPVCAYAFLRGTCAKTRGPPPLLRSSRRPVLPFYSLSSPPVILPLALSLSLSLSLYLSISSSLSLSLSLYLSFFLCVHAVEEPRGTGSSPRWRVQGRGGGAASAPSDAPGPPMEVAAGAAPVTPLLAQLCCQFPDVDAEVSGGATCLTLLV